MAAVMWAQQISCKYIQQFTRRCSGSLCLCAKSCGARIDKRQSVVICSLQCSKEVHQVLCPCSFATQELATLAPQSPVVDACGQ